MFDEDTWVVEFRGEVRRVPTNYMMRVPEWDMIIQITWSTNYEVHDLNVYRHGVYTQEYLLPPGIVPHRANHEIRCWKRMPRNTVQLIGCSASVELIRQLLFPRLVIEQTLGYTIVYNTSYTCAMFIEGEWGFDMWPKVIIRLQHINQPVSSWIGRLAHFFQVQVYQDPTTFRWGGLDEWILLLDHGNPTTGMIPPNTTQEMERWHQYTPTGWWKTPSQTTIPRQLAAWYREFWRRVDGLLSLPRLPRELQWHILSYGFVPPDVTIHHLSRRLSVPWGLVPDRFIHMIHRMCTS